MPAEAGRLASPTLCLPFLVTDVSLHLLCGTGCLCSRDSSVTCGQEFLSLDDPHHHLTGDGGNRYLQPLHCAFMCSDLGGWSGVLFFLVTEVPPWSHIPDVFLGGHGTRSWPSSGVTRSSEKTLEYMTFSHNRQSVANQWSCIKENSQLTQVTTTGHLTTETKWRDLFLEGSPQTVCP